MRSSEEDNHRGVWGNIGRGPGPGLESGRIVAAPLMAVSFNFNDGNLDFENRARIRELHMIGLFC